jgi:MFS family permease
VTGAPAGRRALAVVALGFVAMLASSPGQSYWLSLFVDDMIAGTGLSRPAFSTVYAIGTVCSAVMVLAMGVLFDRRGPALAWLLVACGLAAGGVVMSVAAGAGVAIVGLALLRAFGQGSFPLVGTLLVARTFDAWRGRALSIAYLGSTLAAAGLPLVAAVLIDGVGWRAGLRITALVVLVVVAPLTLAVRWTVGPRARRVRPRPTMRPARIVRAGTARFRRFPWRDGGAVMLVALSVAPMASTAVVFHATSLLATHGLGKGAAAAALGAMAVTGALGSLAGGAVVDRAGVHASVLAMNGLLAVGLTLLLVPSVAGAFASFAVIGAASGINGTGAGAAWAHTYGVARLGELQGIGESARIGAAAFGPLPLALALSLSGSYAVGLVVLAGLAALCAVGGARLRPRAAVAVT